MMTKNHHLFKVYYGYRVYSFENEQVWLANILKNNNYKGIFFKISICIFPVRIFFCKFKLENFSNLSVTIQYY